MQKAWRSYLHQTKKLKGKVYERVEPIAWEGLQEQLDKIVGRDKVVS